MNRDTNNESEYFIRLEPKLVRILSLIQRYKAAQEYSEVAKRHTEVIAQSKKIEEKNKRLRHVLESCHRPSTEKEEPPIELLERYKLVRPRFAHFSIFLPTRGIVIFFGI